ncbi:MAG: type IV pilus assembly protein PilM [Magnetococcus sp. YQC-3]
MHPPSPCPPQSGLHGFIFHHAMFSLTTLFRKQAPRQAPHRPVVGLDIGSSSIKMAEIRRSGRQWELLHCGVCPLPPDAVVEGQIKQPETVTQAIRELLAANNVTNKQAAISLGGASVITKKIQMTPMTELDLEDQIALEAEEYIPFDIEEVSLDFQIIDQHPESMDVLLTACKKEIVQSHTEVVRQAGLEPRVCDLDLFCLINAYQAFIQPHAPVTPRSPTAENRSGKPATGIPQEKQSIALVNMGTNFLNIAIVTNNGLPGYIRDHSLGGRQVINEIKTRHDISWAEAERLLIMPEGAGERHSEPANLQTDIVQPFLEQVTQQIRQAINFHRTGNPEQPVAAVALAGGCALWANAAAFIMEHLDLPVQTADPFANLTHRRLQGKQETEKTTPILQMAPRFMVALGLALRGDM